LQAEANGGKGLTLLPGGKDPNLFFRRAIPNFALLVSATLD